MNKSAVQLATQALNRAQEASAAMQASKSFDQFESAWTDFLVASHRVYSKLEQGAKANGKSKAWFGRKRHERRKDQLLSYIHHARNADEHGLQRVTQRTPGGVGIGGKGGVQIDKLSFSMGGGRLDIHELQGHTPDGGPIPVTLVLPGIRVITVFDRGDHYDPPTTHLEEPLEDASPQSIAKLALDYLTDLTKEAAGLPD